MSSLGGGSDLEADDEHDYASFSETEEVEVISDDSDDAVIISPAMSSLSDIPLPPPPRFIAEEDYPYPPPGAFASNMSLADYIIVSGLASASGSPSPTRGWQGLHHYEDEPELYSTRQASSSRDIPPDPDPVLENEPLRRPTELPDHLKYCALCKDPADLLCRCYKVVYCSVKHQEEDWANHMTPCANFGLKRSTAIKYQGPFDVTQDLKSAQKPKPSFSLKAQVTIPTQQKIFDESPILVCPWPRTQLRQCEDFSSQPWKQLTLLSCFGCGLQLGLGDIRNICCGGCNLPLCSEQCPNILTHKLNECVVIKQYQRYWKKTMDKPEVTKMLIMGIDEIEFVYEDVMMVRLIKHFMAIEEKEFGMTFGDTLQIQNGFKSTEWTRLMKVWKMDETKRMDSIRAQIVRNQMPKVFGFSLYLTGGDYNLVWRLYCILESNSFSFQLPYKRYKVLCSVLPLVRNSCIPNSHAFLIDACSEDGDASANPEFLVRVVSGEQIPQGDHITFSYMPSIFCTLERRLLLLDKYSFWCNCKRCLDPSEMETYVGSFSCIECRVKKVTGYKTPSQEFLRAGPQPCPNNSTESLECADLSQKLILRSKEYNWTCTQTSSHQVTHGLVLQQFVRSELDVLRTLGDYPRAYTLYQQNSGATHGQHSTLLKMCEDILRGDFFRHPKTKESADLPEIRLIQAAKSTMTSVMKILNPAFDFQGYPMNNLRILDFNLPFMGGREPRPSIRLVNLISPFQGPDDGRGERRDNDNGRYRTLRPQPQRLGQDRLRELVAAVSGHGPSIP